MVSYPVACARLADLQLTLARVVDSLQNGFWIRNFDTAVSELLLRQTIWHIKYPLDVEFYNWIRIAESTIWILMIRESDHKTVTGWQFTNKLQFSYSFIIKAVLYRRLTI